MADARNARGIGASKFCWPLIAATAAGAYRHKQKTASGILVKMFPLNAKKLGTTWEEDDCRQRIWVALRNAKKLVSDKGLKEIIELVTRG